jgi:hypothetical protein
MQFPRSWLLAGAAALVIAGGAAIAQAESPQFHVFTVQLPGGGTETVHYTGDVKPRIEMMPADLPAAFLAPADFFPEFAAFDRISAEMDRAMAVQMAAVRQQADAMRSAAESGRFDAAFGPQAPGTFSYQEISTWSGDHGCTRITRISMPQNGTRPEMVSSTAGDCGAATPASAGPIQASAPAPTHAAPAHRI